MAFEAEFDASQDQLASLYGDSVDAGLGLDEGVTDASHLFAQELDSTIDALSAWPDDPTNPVNRSSEPTMHILSTTLLSGLNSDQTYPDVTTIRHQLQLRRARIVAIESVPDMTLEAKLLLREVLGDTKWPTRFRTHENLQVPTASFAANFATPWSTEDEYALRLLVLYIPPHVTEIASTFFPERSAMDVFAKIEEMFPLDEGQERASEEGRGSFDVSAAAREALRTMTWDQMSGMLGLVMAMEEEL
jgi:hypothetical protein